MELHGEVGQQQACSYVNWKSYGQERLRVGIAPAGSAVHWHNYLAYEARIGWDVSMADWNAEGTPVSLVAAQANAVFAEVNAISN